eukprot:4931763-Amphidinium_carterae.1
MMGPERVYENGPKQHVGYDQGRQWIARLVLPEVSRSSAGTTPLGRSSSPPQRTSVPVFGAQHPDANGNRGVPETTRPSSFTAPAQGSTDQGNPGGSVLGSSGANLGSGGIGSGMPQSSFPVQGGREPARSASPITINDEKILGRYFTRGSQGAGEEERAAMLSDIERGVIEPFNHHDTKEKWNGLDTALPALPQGTDEDKGQVHVRASLERWESNLIMFYATISPKAGAYIRAVLAGVAKALPLYRKDHNPQIIQTMNCAEVAFHPIAEAHTCRFLTVMKLPHDSYGRAASIRLESCARIQLLMHYDRILPPPPVELKRCQEYFLSPP